MQVVHIDIANDPVLPADYKKDEDPKTFKSEKTGRGPLSGEWQVRAAGHSVYSTASSVSQFRGKAILCIWIRKDPNILQCFGSA